MELSSATAGRVYLSCALTGVEQPRKGQVEAFNVSLRDTARARGIAIYLPQEASSPDHEDGLTPSEVYALDRLRIAESDAVIADFDQPSFGVGQEIEMAGAMGIPIIGYHREGVRVSRMVLGHPGLYHDSGDAVPTPLVYSAAQAPGATEESVLIEAILRRVDHALRSTRQTAVNSRLNFGVILKAARESVGMSTEQVSHLSGVSVALIKTLEMTRLDLEALVGKTKRPTLSEIDFNKFQSVSRSVTERLQDALNVRESDYADLGSPSDFGLPLPEPTVRQSFPPSGATLDLFTSNTPASASAPTNGTPDGDFGSHEFESDLHDLFAGEGATYEEVVAVSERVGFEIAFMSGIHLNRDGAGSDIEQAREALAAVRVENSSERPPDADAE